MRLCHRTAGLAEFGGTMRGPTVPNAGAGVQRGLADTRHHRQRGFLGKQRATSSLTMCFAGSCTATQNSTINGEPSTAAAPWPGCWPMGALMGVLLGVEEGMDRSGHQRSGQRERRHPPHHGGKALPLHQPRHQHHGPLVHHSGLPQQPCNQRAAAYRRAGGLR